MKNHQLEQEFKNNKVRDIHSNYQLYKANLDKLKKVDNNLLEEIKIFFMSYKKANQQMDKMQYNFKSNLLNLKEKKMNLLEKIKILSHETKN